MKNILNDPMDTFVGRAIGVIIALLFIGFAHLAHAGTTATVTPSTWDGYRGTSIVTRGAATEAACVDALKRLGVTRDYTCRTRTAVSVVVTADPPPTCGPQPANETRTVACPAGTTGSWTQTRAYISSPYPTCWVAGEYSPASAPPLACTPVVEPTPPPPTGDAIIVNPGESISNAVAKLQPGGTVIVKAGTYSAFSLKACTAAAWCTIKSEVDGGAVLTGFSIGNGDWYTRIEGFKVKSASSKPITAGFVQLRRMAFEGGPSSGNDVNVQIGTNDRTPGAHDILVEDSYAYGLGGRYKILVYNANRVVLRRVVVRHDGGWKYDGQNPQGGITIYDSTNVRVQNSGCVDSVQGLSGFEACIYLVSNGTTSTRASNVVVSGSFVIDSPNNGIAAEGQASASWSVVDVLVRGSKAGGFNTNGQGRMTVTRGYANVIGAPYAAWNGSLSASACVYKGGSNASASLSNCSGTLPLAVNVLNANGQGADIRFRLGVDGTTYGDAGFEDVTAVPLWPYPNQDRIKADFDSVRAAFGGKTLTNYVLGQ